MTLDTRFIFELPIPLLLLLSALMYYKGLFQNSQLNNKVTARGTYILLFSTLYMLGIGICADIYKGQFFISSLSDALLYALSLIALTQLLSEYFGNSGKLGVFTVIPLFIGSLILPFSSHKPWSIEDPYFSLHILSSISSYSFFFIACIFAFMHQLLWNKLKKKEFDTLFAALPNYEKVEVYAFIWILLGILSAIFSSIFGLQWWAQTNQETSFPIISFLIFLPFGVVALLRSINVLNGIFFTRSIFIAMSLLLVKHFIGLH